MIRLQPFQEPGHLCADAGSHEVAHLYRAAPEHSRGRRADRVEPGPLHDVHLDAQIRDDSSVLVGYWPLGERYQRHVVALGEHPELMVGPELVTALDRIGKSGGDRDEPHRSDDTGRLGEAD